MSPLLETMAKGALVARIERLEATVKHHAELVRLLVSGMFHHVQNRHDATMHTDDAPDVVAVRRARRVLSQQAKTTDGDVAAVRRSETKHERNKM